MIDIGDTAPDFTLPGLDGLKYSLHESGSEPVLLAILQADCGACKLAAPYLNRLHAAYENIGWVFWIVLQDNEADARRFAAKYELRPTVLLDASELSVSSAYDPDATPTLYLIEPERRVTLVSRGFDKRELNEISRRIARYTGTDYVEVAPADDGNPAFKPG